MVGPGEAEPGPRGEAGDLYHLFVDEPDNVEGHAHEQHVDELSGRSRREEAATAEFHHQREPLGDWLAEHQSPGLRENRVGNLDVGGECPRFADLLGSAGARGLVDDAHTPEVAGFGEKR